MVWERHRCALVARLEAQPFFRQLAGQGEVGSPCFEMRSRQVVVLTDFVVLLDCTVLLRVVGRDENPQVSGDTARAL